MNAAQRQQLRELLFDYRRYAVTDDVVLRFVDEMTQPGADVPANGQYEYTGQNIEDQRPGNDAPPA